MAHDLGVAAALERDWPRALRHFRKALRENSRQERFHNSFAVTLWVGGFGSKARAAFERGLRLFPLSPYLLFNFAKVLQEAGDSQRACAALEAVLATGVSDAAVVRRTAELLQRIGRVARSDTRWRQYLSMCPEDGSAWNNFAGTLCRQGRIDDALQAYARARLHDRDPAIASNALMVLHYAENAPRRRVFAAHRSWANRVETNPAAPCKTGVRRRKLRIGYVSGDFRRHSVACFFEPILEHHDRSRFELHCFSNNSDEDVVTRRMRKQAEWHEIWSVDDEAAAAQIRRAGIDILMDLSGHTAHNRLPLFARRPASIQGTYLGYPDTTGLRAIDYRFTDPIADPPGISDKYHSETLVRIEPCFLSYRPPDPLFQASPAPARRNGYVTFGCFAIREKLSPTLIEAWTRILRGSPGSRLLLKSKSVSDPGMAQQLMGLFEDRGVSRDRLIMLPYTPDSIRHLRDYKVVDLILDTWPYNGTTATCEALSLGVPVLTWCGATHASRVGASILTGLGLTHFVARSAREYISHALEFAADPPALSAIRRGLRDTWNASPLSDGEKLTEKIESCYLEWARR
jgi:predicted O-linked N-acetylglucosamine transferase (SPINDLY family)